MVYMLQSMFYLQRARVLQHKAIASMKVHQGTCLSQNVKSGHRHAAPHLLYQKQTACRVSL